MQQMRLQLELLGERLRESVRLEMDKLAGKLCDDDWTDLELVRRDLRAARECLREYRLLCEEWQALEQLRLPFGGGAHATDSE